MKNFSPKISQSNWRNLDTSITLKIVVFEGNWYKKYWDQPNFQMVSKFPRFSPTCFVRRKARAFRYPVRQCADLSRSNIDFPLRMLYSWWLFESIFKLTNWLIILTSYHHDDDGIYFLIRRIRRHVAEAHRRQRSEGEIHRCDVSWL